MNAGQSHAVKKGRAGQGREADPIVKEVETGESVDPRQPVHDDCGHDVGEGGGVTTTWRSVAVIVYSPFFGGGEVLDDVICDLALAGVAAGTSLAGRQQVAPSPSGRQAGRQ